MANFVKVSCYYINLDNVACVEYHQNLIHFIGGQTLNMSSELMREFKDSIDEQVRQVKHGKWRFVNQATSLLEPPNGDTCECPECGYEIDVSETIYRYCPMCGLPMEGGVEC